MKINMNKMPIHSLEAFFSINGRYAASAQEKDCCFLCYIGFDQSDTFPSRLIHCEKQFLTAAAARGAGYFRTDKLPFRPTPDEVSAYQQILGQINSLTESKLDGLHFAFNNPVLDSNVTSAIQKTRALFTQVQTTCSDSMLNNFTTKLLYWIDTYFPKLFLPGFTPQASPKFVFHGPVKLQEYLFLYLLTQVGCDILYLNTQAHPDLPQKCLALSQVHEDANRGSLTLPPFIDQKVSVETVSTPSQENGAHAQTSTAQQKTPPSRSPEIPHKQGSALSHAPVSRPPDRPSEHTGSIKASVPMPPNTSNISSGCIASIPMPPYQRNENTGGCTATIPMQTSPSIQRRSSMSTIQSQPAASGNMPMPHKPARQSSPGPVPSPPPRPVASISQTELDYEQLASMASSVVMVEVADNKGQPFKSGSGVMIGRDGYILTNFHVTNEGALYGIRIEGEERIYETSRIVKYNPLFDLAVLQIDRQLTPIPLCQNRKLTRGQKVVAIGSPLGLFNTVSDGIISAFRSVRDVPMIQFTAPISSGSSGGAVLNMYGELIGLSTAGFDDGQNLNLAVDYNTIRSFLGNLLG